MLFLALKRIFKFIILLNFSFPIPVSLYQFSEAKPKTLFLVLICISCFLTLFNFQGTFAVPQAPVAPLGDSLVNIPLCFLFVNTFFRIFLIFFSVQYLCLFCHHILCSGKIYATILQLVLPSGKLPYIYTSLYNILFFVRHPFFDLFRLTSAFVCLHTTSYDFMRLS